MNEQSTYGDRKAEPLPAAEMQGERGDDQGLRRQARGQIEVGEMEYAGAAVGSRQDYQSAYTQPGNIAATEIACEHPRGQQKPENAQHSKQERRAGQIQHMDNGCIQR